MPQSPHKPVVEPEPSLHRFALEVPLDLGDLAVAELWGICPQGFEEQDVLSSEGEATGWRFVLYASSQEADALSSALSSLVQMLRSVTTRDIHIQADRIQDQNWREAWKVHFTLQRVPPFVIRPSWIPYAPGPGEHVIHLDPGSAFGTGLHESTRLCLRAMASLARDLGAPIRSGKLPGNAVQEPSPLPRRVLDFGTGTGILGIAACGLFPCHVLAVDNDPLALRACKENVRNNQVEDRFTLASGLPEASSHHDIPLHDLGLSPGSQETRNAGSAAAEMPGYDLTLANVSRPVLVEEASALVTATVPGGTLVLSGLLVGDAQDVLGAFSSCGAFLVEQTQENDWIALRLAVRPR